MGRWLQKQSGRALRRCLPCQEQPRERDRGRPEGQRERTHGKALACGREFRLLGVVGSCKNVFLYVSFIYVSFLFYLLF